jgi:hypothetical protein
MASLQERLDEFKTFESGAPPYNAPHEVIEPCIAPRPSARLRGSKGER